MGGVGDPPSALLAYSPLIYYRADEGVEFVSGSEVNKWVNQGSVGASADIAQSTATQYPTLTLADANFGGKPALAFDGNDRLEKLGVVTDYVDVAIWCVLNVQAVTALDTAWEVYSQGHARSLGRQLCDSTTPAQQDFQSHNGTVNGAAFTLDQAYTVTGYALTSVGSEWFINNASQGTAINWGNQGPLDIALGARPGGGEPCECTIAEWGLFPSASFDASARTVAQAYAVARYGI